MFNFRRCLILSYTLEYEINVLPEQSYCMKLMNGTMEYYDGN